MRLRALVLVLLTACGATSPRIVTGAPAWREATAGVFAEAASHDRLVLLSVQADWCHWCHVMNATTYADPDVLALLADHFVVMRAEADARPDLAERYTNYGWPATILFAPDGREIVRLRGHRDPHAFRAILEAVIGDQRAGRPLGSSLDDHVTDAPREAALGDLDDVRVRVRAQLDAQYEADGGWGREQRYPFGALVQHALLRARDEDEPEWRERGLLSLGHYAELIDPVWGGMYQYSEQGDWAHPHYEKIASIQAGAIAAFADAYAATGDETWLTHARSIVDYLTAQLSSSRYGFYASQDADLRVDGQAPVLGATYYALDDAGRRALGIPHVDTHVYASASAELAASIARLAEVTGDVFVLELARETMTEVVSTHRDPTTGLYRHERSSDDPFRYLADQAHVLSGLIAVHQATGDDAWRRRARELADAMLETFRDETTGALRSRNGEPDPLASPLASIEENAVAARALLVLALLDDDDTLRDRALEILRGVAVPSAIAEQGRKVGRYAIALELARLGMVSFTVVGAPHDPRTLDLIAAVHAYDEPRRVLVLQPDEGHYPQMDEPVLFVCGADACSEPIGSESDIPASIDRFFGR